MSQETPPYSALPRSSGWFRLPEVGRAIRRQSAEVGMTELVTVAICIVLVAIVIGLFVRLRPPNLDDIERDIWSDWARLATDAQGLTLVDLLVENNPTAVDRIVKSFGDLFAAEGPRFVVFTEVRYLGIRGTEDELFAQWRAAWLQDDWRFDEGDRPLFDINPVASAERWKERRIPLVDERTGHTVGTLDVSYRFYGGGLDYLPNLLKLQSQYQTSLILICVLAALIVMLGIVNVLRIRERVGRLHHQQMTLDLAQQMCHELRNGLWAFSLEGKNVRRLFDQVERLGQRLPTALDESLAKLLPDPAVRQRVPRRLTRQLADEGLDPEEDILPSVAIAASAFDQIESFSRFITLTVDELDRHLLGTADELHVEPLSVREVWEEACSLMSMRLRTAEVRLENAVEDVVVLVDRRCLVHVFVNLLKNAMEALHARTVDRVVRLVIRSTGPRAVIAVSNNGPAIDASVIGRIFERGFTTKGGSGRGTGLFLIRENLADLGSTIRVTSSPDWTTFEVELPLAPSPGPVSRSPTSAISETQEPEAGRTP